MSRNPLAVRRTLQRIVPVVVWFLVVGLAYWLHTESAGSGQARGLAEVKEFAVSAVETGRLTSLDVVLGQRVSRGQVVATLDAEMLDREIAVAEAELREMEAQVPAEGKSLELSRLETERAFQAELEEAGIEIRDARAGQATDRAELAGLREELARQRGLVKQQLTSTDRMKDLEMRLAALEESVAGWPSRIEALEKRELAARERLEEWRSTNTGASSVTARRAQLRPLELRIIRQHEYLSLLRKRLGNMVLRAPADAHVATILARKGSVLTPGDPVMVMVEDRPQQVIAYVEEDRGYQISVGDKVRLRSPDPAGHSAQGTVVGIAGTVAELPPRFWPSPGRARWGREVFIRVDQGHELDPGEAFDITFERKAASPDLAKPVAAAGNIRDDSAPRPTPLSTPPEILKRSRFEPSGLTWIDGLQRYLVVSDDTGHEAANDNAPWAFTMNENGVVDPEPVVLGGIRAVNDLEAVAASQEGAIYMISSQSVNRRGKRNPARTLFLRARRNGEKLAVEGSVHFYDLLVQDARQDSSLFSSLGLRRPSPVVEIEGLAWHDGALFFGLKDPLDPSGKALIWRLDRPDAPFDSGSLSDSGLALWAKVLLEAADEPAGISELLFLDDGSLVIAATNDKGGALFHARQTATGNLRVRTVADYPGLKPEGLSLSPARDRLVIAFDCQQETPLWTQLEVPQ